MTTIRTMPNSANSADTSSAQALVDRTVDASTRTAVSINHLELDLKSFTASNPEAQARSGARRPAAPAKVDPHIAQLEQKDEVIKGLEAEKTVLTATNDKLSLRVAPTPDETLAASALFKKVFAEATNAAKPEDAAKNVEAATLALAVVASRIEQQQSISQPITVQDLQKARDQVGAVYASDRDSIQRNGQLANEHLALIGRQGIDEVKLEAFLSDAVAKNGAIVAPVAEPAQEEDKKSAKEKVGGWLARKAREINPANRIPSRPKGPGETAETKPADEPARADRDLKVPDFIIGLEGQAK